MQAHVLQDINIARVTLIQSQKVFYRGSNMMNELEQSLAKPWSQIIKHNQIMDTIYIIYKKDLEFIKQELEQNIQEPSLYCQSGLQIPGSQQQAQYHQNQKFGKVIQLRQKAQVYQSQDTRVVQKKLYKQLASRYQNLFSERKVVIIKGIKTIQLIPVKIEMTMIEEQRIWEKSKLLYKLVFDARKTYIYSYETIQDLKIRVSKLFQRQSKQVKIYVHDKSFFKYKTFQEVANSHFDHTFRKIVVSTSVQSSFNRIQYDKLNDLTHKYLLDQDQTRVLNFLPGKLLQRQNGEWLRSNKLTDLIVEVRQYRWLFPNGAQKSLKDQCSYCLLQSQLFIKFQCHDCYQNWDFCCQSCYIQFIDDHPCDYAQDWLKQKYSESYLRDLLENDLDNDVFQEQIQAQIQSILMSESIDNTQLPLSELLGLHQSLDLKITEPYRVTGLSNLRNTCYMNAALQMLLATRLRQWMMLHESTILSNQKCILSQAFLNLILLYNKKSQAGTGRLLFEEMRRFKLAIQKQIPLFKGDEQHDSHQFLILFFEKMQSQLNLNQNRKANKLSIDTTIDTVAEVYWIKTALTKNNPLLRLFSIIGKNEIRCDSCKQQKTKIQVSNILSLPVDGQVQETKMIQFFYQYSQYQSKTELASAQCSGQTVSDFKRRIINRYKRPQTHPRKGLFCLTSYQNAIIQFDNLFQMQQIIQIAGKTNEKQNQLFFFEIPYNHRVTIFTQFTINNVLFTFRKPLFFTKDKQKIQNKDIYNAVLNYNFNIAIYQMTLQNKKALHKVRQKWECNITNYLQIWINYYPNRQVQIFYTNERPLKEMDEIELKVNIIDRSNSDQKDLLIENIKSKSNRFTKEKIKPQQFLINDDRQYKLENMIKQIMNTETLQGSNSWLCDICKQKEKAYKKFKLIRFNRYIIIHLKRFIKTNKGFFMFKKNERKINIPMILNIDGIAESYFLPEEYYQKQYKINQLQQKNLLKQLNLKEQKNYQLKGIILHYGKMNQGHYYAFIEKGLWYNFNDHQVNKINIEQQLKSERVMKQAFILLYQRKQ